MNKYSLFLICLIFYIGSGLISKARSVENKFSGRTELNYPYVYFLRITEFKFIYGLPENSQYTDFLDENFLESISKKKYNDAEKWLLKNYEHPYYLLNLILLQEYSGKKDYQNLFIQWQKATSLARQANFIDLLVERKLNHALEGFSDLWLDPALKRYSNYHIFKRENQVNNIMENFFIWKKNISQNEFSKKLYDIAKSDWDLSKTHLVPGTENLPRAKYTEEFDFSKPLSPQKMQYIEENLINSKLTRDVFTRYLNYLRNSQQWERIKIFVKKIPWLSENEKEIFSKTPTPSMNTPVGPAEKDDTLKLKISH